MGKKHEIIYTDWSFIYGRSRNHKIMAFLALFLALAECLRVIGFITVNISYPILIPALLVPVALSLLSGSVSVNSLIAVFLLYIPLNLLVCSPPVIFQPWSRYILFLMVLLSVSPLFNSRSLRIFRLQCLKIILIVIMPLSFLSFFCYFLGINFFNSTYGEIDYTVSVGAFAALFKHSMILGPLSALSSCVAFWMFLKNIRKKLSIIITVICAGSVMFSASRAALLGTFLACVIMLYFNSKNRAKNLRTLLVLCIVGCCTFPLWEGALSGINKKNEINSDLGEYGSRTDKFTSRLLEFESSPIFGIGFSSVDINGDDYFDKETGVIEPGSSWLATLSMTGIFGFVILLLIFVKTFRILAHSGQPVATLFIGFMTFFTFHMIFEGYIFAGGSVLCFLLWLVIGVSTDIKYANRYSTSTC